MRVVTVARKPLSEPSVTRNALKWGVGGVNIDASRVGETGGTAWVPDADAVPPANRRSEWDVLHAPSQKATLPSGRWPANVILEHHPECKDKDCHPDCPCLDLEAQHEGSSRYFQQVTE